MGDQVNQLKMDSRKQVRVKLSTDTVRLAKAKAASQEISLWFVIERLLQQWIRGDVGLINGNGSKGGKR